MMISVEYSPLNQDFQDAKSPFAVGKSTMNGPFSIAILITRGFFLLHGHPYPSQSKGNPAMRCQPKIDDSMTIPWVFRSHQPGQVMKLVSYHLTAN